MSDIIILIISEQSIKNTHIIRLSVSKVLIPRFIYCVSHGAAHYRYFDKKKAYAHVTTSAQKEAANTIGNMLGE